MIHKKYTIFIYVIALFSIVSCNQVTVKVDSIPANTPIGSQIYIAGNFNNWNPSDPNYILELGKDSSYYVTLPYGIGLLQYKFSRGDWSNVETDECGHLVDNRIYNYTKFDTIVNTIESWDDKEPLNCPRLTIIIDSIPENTPDDAEIRIAGNFNEWNPNGEVYRLERNENGQFQVTMMKPKLVDKLEFKFTRGDISKIESDKYGNELPKRLIQFGVTDTIYTSIENWEDLTDVGNKFVTIFIEKLPKKTYENDHLYVVGNFNGWYPRDRNYQLEKDSKGNYYINLPRKDGKLEFKITRGSWETQELDKYGNVLDNRSFSYRDFDTIFIAVDYWADRTPPKKLIFKVFDYPDNTPEDDAIYIAGNFNGWDPMNKYYKMTKTENNDYIIEVQIEDKRVEYKFTRGGWEKEEADKKGYKIENRVHEYIGIDTIYVSIESWYDVPYSKNKITIAITSIPENTPKEDDIYFVSNINGWDPWDENNILEKKGNYYFISIRLNQREVYYKFTRGGWRTVEGDKYGGEIGNRELYFNDQDTIYHSIEGWKDLRR